MTLVAVAERPLPHPLYKVPVGCKVETEYLSPLKFVLVVGLTFALNWATMVGLAILAQAGALLLSLLEFSDSCYQT